MGNRVVSVVVAVFVIGGAFLLSLRITDLERDANSSYRSRELALEAINENANTIGRMELQIESAYQWSFQNRKRLEALEKRFENHRHRDTTCTGSSCKAPNADVEKPGEMSKPALRRPCS